MTTGHERFDAVVIGSGLGGLVCGAYLAAGAAIGADLWRLVRSGEVLGDRALLPELRPDWDAWRVSH